MLDLNLLFDDVMALVDEKPLLVSGLERELRDGSCPSGTHWRKLVSFSGMLREMGLEIAHVWDRTGSNILATYVWHAPFTTVMDGRGREKMVRA
jgi:hypothetical protein